MSNQKLLKILNPVMAILFICVAVAIILLKYPVVPVLQGNETVYYIHEIAGKIFIALAVLHIILNWNWILITCRQVWEYRSSPRIC